MSGPDWRLEGPDWPHHQHSRFVEAGGVRWHLQSLGEGPPMLLVHGTGASTHSFRALMPLLAAHHTVMAVDLPGHGFSTARPGYVPSLVNVAASLSALLGVLELTPATVVGHSAGAAILAQMALTGAISPTHLVSLAGAFVPFGGVGTSLFLPAARLLAQTPLAAQLLAFRARDLESVERLVRSTGSLIDRPGVELYHRLARTPGHVGAVLSMMANWDLAPLYQRLSTLTTPLLLLAGENDRAVPLAQQREVAARSGRARLVVVPGTGHLLHEEKPTTLARLILDEVSAP